MTTREPVPRMQLEESHSGVPPEATTTEVNLEPRSRRHGRLLETAPTTKVTCWPGPYRCRAERRASSTAPLPQVCRQPLGASGRPRPRPRAQVRGLPGRGLQVPALGLRACAGIVCVAYVASVGPRWSLARGLAAAERLVHRPDGETEHRNAGRENDCPATPVGSRGDQCLAHKSII
jgi:hypothetical protein